MDEITKLVLNVKNGKEADFEILCQRYELLIKSMSKKYSDMCSFHFEENEDFIQESKLALYNAVLTYNIEKNDITFGAYAKVCIRNKLISRIRSLNSKKRKKGNMMSKDTTSDSQNDLALREWGKAVISFADSALSDYEKRVFTLFYLKGNKPRDIANAVGKDQKSVYNTICRIKAKLKRLRKNDT